MLERKQIAVYLAGFIDGEGCFGIYKKPNRKTRLLFAVGGQDELNMEEVQKMFHSLDLPTNMCQRADGLYMIQTEKYAVLADLIAQIRPFMRNEDKICKTIEMMEIIEGNPEPARNVREVQRL